MDALVVGSRHNFGDGWERTRVVLVPPEFDPVTPRERLGHERLVAERDHRGHDGAAL